MSLNKLDT